MELLGILKTAEFPLQTSLLLRKKNSIKTIRGTVQIEGNPFEEPIITQILDGKKVLGLKDEIKEVQNALQLYQEIDSYNPTSEKDFIKAHKTLMSGLLPTAGSYRKVNVGIGNSKKLKYIAPPHQKVKKLMQETFKFIEKKPYDDLLMGILAHYHIETIHPFEDGNGRMGRFYQTLYHSYFLSPLFQDFSVESFVHQHQKEYFKTLNRSQTKQNSNYFAEYMLDVILEAFEDYTKQINKGTFENRIELAKNNFKTQNFKRTDYLKFHQNLSTATASRDLKKAVDLKIIDKAGEKNQTLYKFK